ncbi:hypothetical protein P0Y67_12585 [Photobacterium sp. SP02]|uniref:imm11 family protein n=1 Tax=Photobacterium sp. SP02 TaxID=3032280 RepID=UPI003145230C
MKYYLLESKFIEDEASFSFVEDFNDIEDKSDLSIKYYKKPPLIKVDQVYKQRRMSDVLKTVDYIAHRRLVDVLTANFATGVQFIPVDVDVDGKMYHDYFYMNIFPSYNLLHLSSSQARNYSDYYNSYDFILNMVFDMNKLNKANVNHDFFRVKEYISEVIINEKIKNIIDENNITGVVAFPVEIV